MYVGIRIGKVAGSGGGRFHYPDGVITMKTKNDEFWRVKQAATILGVAPNSVRK